MWWLRREMGWGQESGHDGRRGESEMRVDGRWRWRNLEKEQAEGDTAVWWGSQEGILLPLLSF